MISRPGTDDFKPLHLWGVCSDNGRRVQLQGTLCDFARVICQRARPWGRLGGRYALYQVKCVHPDLGAAGKSIKMYETSNQESSMSNRFEAFGENAIG